MGRIETIGLSFGFEEKGVVQRENAVAIRPPPRKGLLAYVQQKLWWGQDGREGLRGLGHCFPTYGRPSTPEAKRFPCCAKEVEKRWYLGGTFSRKGNLRHQGKANLQGGGKHSHNKARERARELSRGRLPSPTKNISKRREKTMRKGKGVGVMLPLGWGGNPKKKHCDGAK